MDTRRLLRLPEEAAGCREWADRLSYEALSRIWEEADRMERRILSNVSFELAVELLLMSMKA